MLFLLVLGLILAVASHGQTAEEYRKQAVELSCAKSWDEAIANYRKALELAPNDATTQRSGDDAKTKGSRKSLRLR